MGVLAWSLVGLWLSGAGAGLLPAPGARLPAANVADACQWPTVVSFRSGEEKCTGTLVHPEVVITAAHCLVGGTPDRVRFGETFSPAVRTMDIAECFPRAEFAVADDPAEDIAACRLVAPVHDMPLTPLLGACETEAAIAVGADVTLVGFGIPHTGGDFGTKRYAFTRVVEPPRDDGTFVAGDAMVNGCDGDSGGPAFVRLPDGTWHVAGVLVYGPECGQGPSRYLAASRHLAWLEEVTDRDLTPCRAADGAWDPGPACEVASDPQAIAAAWDAWCDGARSVPDGECTPGSQDTGSAETGLAETSTGAATGAPIDASSSSGATSSPDPPGSREGCRLGTPSPGPGALAIGSWVLVCLASGRRRRVETRG